MEDNAEVMNQQEDAMSQQQEEEEAATATAAAALAAAAAAEGYDFPPLQRYDRVRFWTTRRPPPQVDDDDDEGTLGVVLELDDDNHIGIKSDDGVQDFIQRANIELVMPAALWIREAFKRWCQSEVIDDPTTYFYFRDSFLFQEIEYETIPFDDEMAYELENALRHNETFEKVQITIESPMLFQQMNRECLNNLVTSLLSLPNLQDLVLEKTEDQDIVNAVFANLRVAGRLTYLAIDQSLLPSIQFSQDLQDATEQKVMLSLFEPVVISVETSRNFITQIVALNWFGYVSLHGCSADFVCSLLQEMAINISNISYLEIWQMHTPATAVVSNERTGTRSLFLEALRSYLISRAENNLQPLLLSISQNNINYHHFVDTLLLHDNVCHLNIGCETVDDEVAKAIGHLLKKTKKLRTLELPRRLVYWTCSEDRQLEIIDSIPVNQSLYQLFIGCYTLKTLFGALCNNHSLKKLTVSVGQAGPDDLEALKHFTTLRELIICGISFDIGSLGAALRKNTSLERVEMPCYYPGKEDVCSAEICTKDNQVCTYLARNRWFHQNEALLLKNPGSISAALWSYMLARVSSNPTFLFKIVQSNPDIFLECRPIHKRPRSYMPAL